MLTKAQQLECAQDEIAHFVSENRIDILEALHSQNYTMEIASELSDLLDEWNKLTEELLASISGEK